MLIEKFDIILHDLLFSNDARALELDVTLAVGNFSVRWNNPTICAERISLFLQDTLESYSWSKPYIAHDLSTDGNVLVVNWESTGETGSINCLLQTESGTMDPIPVWPGHIHHACMVLYRKTLKHCCHNFPQPISAFWAKTLGAFPDEHAKFKIGERVRTVVSGNVKTERTGWIWSSCHHYKRNCTVYRLLINDSVYDKWYFDDDLQRF